MVLLFAGNGKQVQRVYKGCRTKNEAFAFVSKLSALSGGNTVLIKTVAETMFFPESGHMKQCIRPDKPPEPNSLKEGRAIMRRIIEQRGNKLLSRLTVGEVRK
jgi:hypothetical protein